MKLQKHCLGLQEEMCISGILQAAVTVMMAEDDGLCQKEAEAVEERANLASWTTASTHRSHMRSRDYASSFVSQPLKSSVL